MKKVIRIFISLLAVFFLCSCASHDIYDLDFTGRWEDIYNMGGIGIPIVIDISNFSWEEFDASISWEVYDIFEKEITGEQKASGHFVRVYDKNDISTTVVGEIGGWDCFFATSNDQWIAFEFADNYTRLKYIAPGCGGYIHVTIKNVLLTPLNSRS